MATQGIVSVVNGDLVVLMKVVAGCSGYNADRLAERLLYEWPVEPRVAYDLAKEVGFGCDACRFVVTEDSILGMNQGTHGVENLENDEDTFPEEDENLFRSTFQQFRFNPRWKYGTADYVRVVYPTEQKITRRR